MSADATFTTFEVKCGFVAIAWCRDGVCGLRLPAASAVAAETAMRKRLPGARRAAPSEGASPVVDRVIRYFESEKVDFADVPVDLGEQEPFHAAVYAEIRKLAWGDTTTYGAVAKALGAGPEAARDVGYAMATNPVPLIVPCHRVLAAGGRIGGFSAPGGSMAKTRMLRIEGVEPAPDPRRADPKAASAQTAFGF